MDTSDPGHFGPKNVSPKCLDILNLGLKCSVFFFFRPVQTENTGPQLCQKWTYFSSSNV